MKQDVFEKLKTRDGRDCFSVLYSRLSRRQDVMMITASHKIIGFSLLFPLLSWGMALTATAMPLPTVETLVEFFLETDSPPCRGVRISKNLMVTSPVCAQKARENPNSELIEVLTLSGEPLGFVVEQPGKLPEKYMLLNIRLDTEALRPGSYPAFYNASSVPGQAFTYSVDEKHQLVQLPVSLAIDETQSKSKFIISSESTLPSGSPVFDLQNKLVCLSESDNRCFTISELPVARARRGLRDDDPDDENGGLSQNAQTGILVGLGVAGIVIPTGLFYLTTYLKAHSKGMPASAYWAGILSLQYCSHCTTSSAMTAIISTIMCPFTGVLSCMVGYPISACMAAFNWIDHTTAPSGEKEPIITQQPYAPPPPPPTY